MNPDKLFDYLDGKLPDWERTQLEQRLLEDEQLRRQFAIAREIHKGTGGSREVLAVDEATTKRGALITRKVVAAFGALVLLNVFVGIAFIIGLNKKPNDLGAHEAAVRKQLMESMEKAATTALPTPSLDVAEIKVPAPRGKVDATAKKLIATAQHFGGTATKGLPDPNGLAVVAEVPAERENDFREALKQLGAISVKPAEPGGTGKKIIQLRILENAK
jgi:hypothetical protein